MTTSAPRAAVKTAWKLLTDVVGGVEAMATACGMSRSLVSEYGNRNSDRFPPAQVIIDAERVAGEPLVTTALARAQGYELVLVQAPEMENSELAALIAETAKDASEIFATAARALTHKDLSESELADLLREYGEMHRISEMALVMLQGLQRKMGGRA